MLVGRNAKIYRTISQVSVDELTKVIDIKIIERIEDDTCVVSDTEIVNHTDSNTRKSVSSETVKKYYTTINKIKQDKVSDNHKVHVEEVEVDNLPLPKEEIKPKTRKPRQPKG